MSNDKKLLGEKKKKERQEQKILLLTLKGKAIDNLTKKEIDDLLQALCLKLGITNKERIIQ